MEYNTSEVISLTAKYIIRRAFKLFEQESRLQDLKQFVGNLYLSSKQINNSVCDELWLEVMHRWMKGRERCALVSKRMEFLLQNNDKKVLFKFMDAVVKIFAKRESVRLLSSYLIKITQSHKDILVDYIGFFIGRNLHMKMPEYRQQVRDFPFLGFKPEHVEKAMQIAYESGHKEECMILFDHFVEYYLRSDEMADHVRISIQKGYLLNFEANIARKVYRGVHYRNQWLQQYLGEFQVSTTNLTEVLHDVSREAAFKMLREFGMRHCTIISFRGSRLIRYCFRRADLQLQNLEAVFLRDSTKIFRGFPNYYAPCPTRYIYYYFRAVVENDLETAKRIQTEHGISLASFENRPHPLQEYIISADPVQKHMIEYLIENFDGVQSCLSTYYPIGYVSHAMLDILYLLTSKGAKLCTFTLWEQFFMEKVPRNVPEFKKLLDLADRSLHSRIATFLFDKFSIMTMGTITDMNMLVLLAWKYGEKTSFLSTLPKEILQLIFGLMNEPLFIQFARLVMDESRRHVSWFPISKETFERSGHAARFILEYLPVLDYSWLSLREYHAMKAIKRDAKYLEEIFIRVNKLLFYRIHFSPRIMQYFVKHSTNKEIWRNLIALDKKSADFALLEYAAIVKNIKLLQLFYAEPENFNRLPIAEKFDVIKRKNKISFEEVLEIARQARDKVFRV
jgi:hypothetical protein